MVSGCARCATLPRFQRSKNKGNQMTAKKSKNKNARKTPAAKKLENALFDEVLASLATSANAIDKRKELLARVAGSIAGGMLQAPSPSISTSSSIAMVAVDIAEEILLKAGIPSMEPVAVSPGEPQAGAAS